MFISLDFLLIRFLASPLLSVYMPIVSKVSAYVEFILLLSLSMCSLRTEMIESWRLSTAGFTILLISVLTSLFVLGPLNCITSNPDLMLCFFWNSSRVFMVKSGYRLLLSSVILLIPSSAIFISSLGCWPHTISKSSFRSRFSSESRFSVEIVKSIFSAIVYSIKFVRVLSYLVLFAFMSLGNRKCKYACFFLQI